MPLTAQLSRNAHTGVYAGLTEPLTLRRRLPNGVLGATQEAWVGYPVPAVETSDAAGAQFTIVRRDWVLFNVGCGKPSNLGPPRIGDQIGRDRDGSWWDIAPECDVTYKDTSNYGFAVNSTKRVVPPVNG